MQALTMILSLRAWYRYRHGGSWYCQRVILEEGVGEVAHPQEYAQHAFRYVLPHFSSQCTTHNPFQGPIYHATLCRLFSPRICGQSLLTLESHSVVHLHALWAASIPILISCLWTYLVQSSYPSVVYCSLSIRCVWCICHLSCGVTVVHIACIVSCGLGAICIMSAIHSDFHATLPCPPPPLQLHAQPTLVKACIHVI